MLHQRLDLLLVVALTRPAKAILEHVMADEPRKPLRALPCAVGQDPGDRELGVVIEDRVRHPTERRRRPRRARRETLPASRPGTPSRSSIRVRQVHAEEVDLYL